MNPMNTGNAEADAINQQFSSAIGMVFQGAWDIVAPFVGAALIGGLIILAIRAIVSRKGSRR